MTPQTLYAEPERHTYLDAELTDPHHRAILSTLARHFDLRAGDAVLEVGAGSGRYTAWLLECGLRVTALEPDPHLAQKLRHRLATAPNLTVIDRDVAHLGTLAHELRAVCGFHVLHHLDEPVLRQLTTVIARAASGNAAFAGWFFVEPNPWNVLYPLQILCTPAMRFAEEAGIWRNDYRTVFHDVANGDCRLGTIGLFPPRPTLRRLPGRVLRRGTDLRRGTSLLRLYTVYGHRTRC